MVIPSKRSITTLVYKSMKLNFISYTKHLTPGTNDINQNYNKILECDWLSVALIIAFIGQFTRHACVIGQYTRHLRALLYRLFGSFSPAKNVNCYVFIHEDI